MRIWKTKQAGIKNYVKPDTEIKTKEFTYTPIPTVIVEADITNYKTAINNAKARYIQQRTTI